MVKTPMRTMSMQMNFRKMVSGSLYRNSLVMQTNCCSCCPGGWPQTILEVICGCEAGWMYWQILLNAFADGLW